MLYIQSTYQKNSFAPNRRFSESCKSIRAPVIAKVQACMAMINLIK